MTQTDHSITIYHIKAREEWTWTCGECLEDGGVYERLDHVTAVVRAHLELHELRARYGATTAG